MQNREKSNEYICKYVLYMPFITFFYKLKDSPQKYWGKYVSNYISDDHDGLDREIKSTVVHGINLYNKLLKIEEITFANVFIGILSYSDNAQIPTYSSDDEIEMFDFYYDNSEGYSTRTKIYVNQINVCSFQQIH